MGRVLGVEIRLADAGAGNKKPHGVWTYPGDEGWCGIVEVTSPPDSELMAAWARAKRVGAQQAEKGSIPVRWNELAAVCEEFLAEDWAREHIDKLLAESADERHLFLFGRSHKVENQFFRRSDPYGDDYAVERIDGLVPPQRASPMSGFAVGRDVMSRWAPRSCGWQGSARRRGGLATRSESPRSTSPHRTQASPTIGCQPGGGLRKTDRSNPTRHGRRMAGA